MSDSSAALDFEPLNGSASSSSLLTRVDSSSILTRVESFTSEPRPALALVQFAEKLGSLCQQLPKQRLVWSKESARLAHHLSSAAEAKCQPPDSEPPKTGGAPSSARRQFRRPRPSEMRSAPVTPRTPSAPSNAPQHGKSPHHQFHPLKEPKHRPTAVSAGDEDGIVLSMSSHAQQLWPHMANVAERARVRQARTGRGGRRTLTPLVVSKPQTASSEPPPRTPSTRGLMRVAEACTEAGLFIIPDASMPVPQLNRDSPEVSLEPAPLTPLSPSDSVPEDSEVKHDAIRSLGSFMVGSGMSRQVSNPRDQTPTDLLRPEGERPSMHQRWSFAVNRLMEERGSTMKTEGMGQLQEVIRQAMSKEISEQPKAEHRDREKRLRWQQQHMQMISQLQELIKTLQQLQPQEESKEMAEPLQMLKKMMGMGDKDNKEAKEAAKEAQEEQHHEPDDPDEPEGPPLATRYDGRQSLSNRKLRFDAVSMEQHRHDNSRGLSIMIDPADLSLPPLCGNVEVHRRKSSVRKGSIAPQEACSLARSCYTRRRGRRFSARGSPLPDSDESHDEDIPPEHEVGRIFRKFKTCEDLFSNAHRRERASAESGEGHSREDIKNKWKKNLQLVRMFGRLSHHPNAPSNEELDFVHELASVNHLMSHDEALRLSVQHNLPIDRVVKCRKLFARADKDNRGELGPEELQNVLREMWKDMHPKSTVLPHALFSSPSAWGSRTKFTEVLRWLSRHSFDEASLVPPEQQRAREFARQWGVPVQDVEEVKDMFDRFDSEKMGFLDFDNFKKALAVILKVPRGMDVPTSRVNIFWKEVDQGKTGKVSFENFFWWYKRSGFNESGHPRASFAGNLRHTWM
mmetsp:Transcript_27176/g.51191  ORF Transcript_27176/g.51191 Transcript_27176/m.51191 type:complete len:853 (+) Transcript_27176:118-2676(+)